MCVRARARERERERESVCLEKDRVGERDLKACEDIE